MAQRLARLEALLAASSALQTSQKEVDSPTDRNSAIEVNQGPRTTSRHANGSSEGLATSILEESQAMEYDSRMREAPRSGRRDGSSLNFLHRAPPPEATSELQQSPWQARSPTLASSMGDAFSSVENRASSTGIEPVLATLSPPSISRGHRRTFVPIPTYSSIAESGGPSTQDEQEGNSVYASEASNWEYHGPRAYLSICSRPGIRWVTENTGSRAFDGVAKKFTSSLTQILKIQKNLSATRHAEPEPTLAWTYTQAYFDEAPEAAFGIVLPSQFTARLRSHFNGAPDDDRAWYALRNAIYAVGCRIVMSKTHSFTEAYRTAWCFFENALSAHTEMLYFHTSILGVRALAVMAYYTECIGSPILEYMLTSSALRLAVSKGLHRQADPSWNMDPQEVCHRNWLFWALYSLEKFTVCRSGRPSVIEDADITCQVPTEAPTGGFVNIAYCSAIIQLAKICSKMRTTLRSPGEFRQRPEAVVSAVWELHSRLMGLRTSMDSSLSGTGSLFEGPIDSQRRPFKMSAMQVIYLRYTYYSALLDVHTTLTYPWSQDVFDLDRNPAIRSQVEQSSQVLAEACRAALLTTKHVNVCASTPLIIAFHGPMYALINLFVYILSNPTHPRIKFDLAIMDIGAGHFAQLEYNTDGDVAMPFTKEIAALARVATTRVKETRAASSFHISSTHMQAAITDQIELMHPAETGQPDRYLENDKMFGALDTDVLDFDLEDWSTLLPTASFDGSLDDFLVPT